MFSLTVEPELCVRDMSRTQCESTLTLTTTALLKTEPGQRPGISAPARSRQMLIVHLVQKSNAITIEAAVGEFAHSVMICINNEAGLFFVITTSLKTVPCSGLHSDILGALPLKFPCSHI